MNILKIKSTIQSNEMTVAAMRELLPKQWQYNGSSGGMENHDDIRNLIECAYYRGNLNQRINRNGGFEPKQRAFYQSSSVQKSIWRHERNKLIKEFKAKGAMKRYYRENFSV